jgi:hypothetical protein
MTYPFEKKYENYKKIRTCLPKDYERVKLKGFIEETTQITNYPFSELCLEDMENMSLLRQYSDYKFRYFKFQVTMCDINNTQSI